MKLFLAIVFQCVFLLSRRPPNKIGRDLFYFIFAPASLHGHTVLRYIYTYIYLVISTYWAVLADYILCMSARRTSLLSLPLYPEFVSFWLTVDCVPPGYACSPSYLLPLWSLRRESSQWRNSTVVYVLLFLCSHESPTLRSRGVICGVSITVSSVWLESSILRRRSLYRSLRGGMSIPFFQRAPLIWKLYLVFISSVYTIERLSNGKFHNFLRMSRFISVNNVFFLASSSSGL